MKVEAYRYEHSPLLSIQIVPETDVEEVLLRSLWQFGRLERVHDGYAIGVNYQEGPVSGDNP